MSFSEVRNCQIMEEADQLLMATLAHLGLKMPDEKVFSFALEIQPGMYTIKMCVACYIHLLWTNLHPG